MKLFVTGGAGFIGSHFVKHVLKTHPGYAVTVLDALTYAGNMDNFSEEEKSKFTFVHGDIRDKDTVRKIMKHSDAVVHFAAETHVDRSLLFAGDFIMTDVYGTFVLLEAAREFPVKRFVHISTDEVYGEAHENPCVEKDGLFPKSPYAASKAGADRLVFSYFVSYGMPVVISRCVNNYGSHQYPEKMIPLFVTNALEDKPLPVYGKGENTREWIHADDHCRALDMLVHADGVDGDVFNIGTQDECSTVDAAKKILAFLGKPESLITYVQDRPGHVLRHAVNSEKIRKNLAWKPALSFDAGLKETVEWYKKNENWWRSIINRQDYQAFHSVWYDERKKSKAPS